MVTDDIQRKLKAIFSADVHGYSKLMGDDDMHTVSTITAYREIIAELIEKGNGRVVDAPGDNILAEFNSSLDAVKSAIEIQNILKVENGKLTDNRRMDFRIGINLGDIIHKDDRIYGDGVNIAARIEKIADPGGICVSRGVYEQVDGKLEFGFADLGPHAVKNIQKPIVIYKMLLYQEDLGKNIGTLCLSRISAPMSLFLVQFKRRRKRRGIKPELRNKNRIYPAKNLTWTLIQNFLVDKHEMIHCLGYP